MDPQVRLRRDLVRSILATGSVAPAFPLRGTLANSGATDGLPAKAD